MSVKRNFTITAILLPLLYLLYSLLLRRYSCAVNSASTIVYMGLFLLIHKRFKFFNGFLYYEILVFLLLPVFVAKSLNAYAYIPHWDKYLHFLSGFLFTGIGKELYHKTVRHHSTSHMRRIFPLFFAIAAAGLWEIWEFSGDKLFGLSAQNNSLTDTMLDMILGTLSSVIASIFNLF